MPPAMKTRGYNRGGNQFIRDNIYSGTRGASLWELAPMLAALSDPGYYFLFQDDFRTFDTTSATGGWVIVEDGTPAQAPIDAANGVLSLATGATNNDEAYVSSLAENWLFAASKPLWFEARVALTEANVDDANIIVGLSDTVGADSLLDNGGGPMASYDGAVWCKVDGGTVWQFETSNAGTQVTTASAGAFVTNTFYRVGFIFDPADGTTGSVTPYLNGVAGTAHAITLAGLEEMHILLGAKAGGSNAETLRIDYVSVLAVR
jgi:hypothetical protein